MSNKEATMNPQDLPDGWHQPHTTDDLYVMGWDGTEVDVCDGMVRIEWIEGADDHRGSARRAREVPVGLVRALLARLDARATP